MRKIKFRAWDSDDKEMYEPMVLAVVDNASLSLSPLRNCKDGNRAYKPHHPLMQFTGLLDKNGNDIYEGDILSYDDGSEKIQIVYNGNAFEGYRLDRKIFFHNNYLQNKNYMQFKIIGNIYENPELLK